MNKYSRGDISFFPLEDNRMPLSYKRLTTDCLVLGTLVASSSVVTYNVGSNINEFQDFNSYIAAEKNIQNDLQSYISVEERYAMEKKDQCYTETMDRLRREILSYKTLAADWDGYGAYPVGVYNAAAALEILEVMSPDVVKSLDDCYPESNGTVSMIWKNELGERVSLSIGTTYFAYYVKSNTAKSIECVDDVLRTPEAIDCLNGKIKAIISV